MNKHASLRKSAAITIMLLLLVPHSFAVPKADPKSRQEETSWWHPLLEPAFFLLGCTLVLCGAPSFPGRRIPKEVAQRSFHPTKPTFRVQAIDHGADGWCGYSSIAAALSIELGTLFEATLTFLDHLNKDQGSILTDLILSQHEGQANRQYDGILSVEQLKEKITHMREQVQEPGKLPATNFWLDELMIQIFEAATETNIVIAQEATGSFSPQSHILHHPQTNTWHTFIHHQNALVSMPAGVPAIVLTFGQLHEDEPFNHYRQLVVNKKSVHDSHDAFYEWLVKHVLDVQPQKGTAEYQLEGTIF